MARGRQKISKEATAFWESFTTKQQQDIYNSLIEWSELRQSLLSRKTTTALLDETIELEVENMMNASNNVFKSIRIRFEVFIKEQSEQIKNSADSL